LQALVGTVSPVSTAASFDVVEVRWEPALHATAVAINLLLIAVS
jgi:hypothetical protein